MVFDLNYRKFKDTKELYSSLENTKLGLYDTQNYIPIYNRFFNLTESNFNNVTLNNRWLIKNIKNDSGKKLYECTLQDSSNNETTKDVFFKCSPLLDPLKFILGKYNTEDKELLPKTLDYSDFNKIKDVNNSAYTDGFFSYLTSKLNEEHDFIHGLDFYGGFLAMQDKFTFDVIDDIEYLYESSNFHKNKGVLFDMDESNIDMFVHSDSSTNKPKIRIKSLNEEIKVDDIDSNGYDDIFDNNEADTSSKEANVSENADLSDNIVFNNDMNTSYKSSRSSSTFSSRTSDTRSNESDEFSDDEDVSESDDDDSNSISESRSSNNSGSSNASENALNINIFNFPVEVICLEGCYETLDRLIDVSPLSNNEWKSIFMQIIMMLLTYEKAFDFTHNDLHTNNVMYIPTEKQFLYYCYQGTYYKVPTYGKIFKIIDFGRAIYKFKGNTFCSDSYGPNGDAATQYNIEPYLSESKPRLEPHYGFDLCRLGCALYDELVEEEDEAEDNDKQPRYDALSELVKGWCMDDKGKNILYKKNGVERYPDFKLYKMISRTVHNPTPQAQLDNPFFSEYVVTKKTINKKAKIMNIDKIPSYVN
tara:strand:- start:1610 stop:3376 length:1767 start_codon:yes stop_codon:yes gene_type:complete